MPRVDWIREKKLDVAYGGDPLQKMDIYYPNEVQKESYPVVILVHGGGFAMCDKRDWHVYPGFHALGRGFALVSVNYRLVPQVSYPAESDDLKRAVLYLRKHAPSLRLQEEISSYMARRRAGTWSPSWAWRARKAVGRKKTSM